MKTFTMTSMAVIFSLAAMANSAEASRRGLPVPVLTNQLCQQAREFCRLADQLCHAPGGDAFRHYSRQVAAHVQTLESLVRDPHGYHSMRHIVNDLEDILDDAHDLARDLLRHRRHHHARYIPGFRFGHGGFHVVIGSPRRFASPRTLTRLCSLIDAMEETSDDLEDAIRRCRHHGRHGRFAPQPAPVILPPAPQLQGPVLRGPARYTPRGFYPTGQRIKSGRSKSAVAFQFQL